MSSLVSVIVPCFDEEAVIDTTHERLVAALEGIPASTFELVYVDDGSRDGTRAALERLQTDDERVRLVCLSRNFGHQVAISAGLDHARGEAVAVIDADLQDPPELIPEMVARWRDGYDVVYGARATRRGEPAARLAAIRAFYWLLNRISDTEIPLDVGDFRLMDRRVVDAIVAMPERDRFLRGMVSWVGLRQVALPYSRDPRHAGATKYSVVRLVGLALDGILSFSVAPLRLAVWLGFLTSTLALAGIVYALVGWTLGTAPRGWPTVFIAVLFLGGVQLIALGIIGEYIGRIYREAKRRPLYLVERRLGFDADGGAGADGAPPDR